MAEKLADTYHECQRTKHAHATAYSHSRSGPPCSHSCSCPPWSHLWSNSCSHPCSRTCNHPPCSHSCSCPCSCICSLPLRFTSPLQFSIQFSSACESWGQSPCCNSQLTQWLPIVKIIMYFPLMHEWKDPCTLSLWDLANMLSCGVMFKAVLIIDITHFLITTLTSSAAVLFTVTNSSKHHKPCKGILTLKTLFSQPKMHQKTPFRAISF